MASIKLSGVHKHYGNKVHALKGVDLDIPPGQFLVILGPSGAGKSTLIRLLNGLETPSEGQVVIDGTELTKRNLRSVRAKVGMVFQQFNLVDRLNVMTNVLSGRLGKRNWFTSSFFLFPRSDLNLAHRSLARVGLVEKAWVRADQLSGGQQQRVGIARALAQEPALILADEPVASLDPITSTEIMGLLRDICDEQGISVVANLHQLDYARDYAHRIIGLNNGRIVFDGPPEQLDSDAEARIYGRSASTRKETRHELVLAHA